MVKLQLDDAKSPGNETWRDALARFERLCHANVLEYNDDDGEPVIVNFSEASDEEQVYEVLQRRSAEELRSYEANYGVSIPRALQELLCEHGPFNIYWYSADLACRWGGRTFLSIDSSNDYASFPNIKPLTKALENNGMYDFVKEWLSPEAVAYLDQRYFAFGHLLEHDQKLTYMLFDREGRFGTFDFYPQAYDTSQSAIVRLWEAEFSEVDFNAFLVKQIDCAIDYLLRYNEVIDEYE